MGEGEGEEGQNKRDCGGASERGWGVGEGEKGPEGRRDGEMQHRWVR